MPQNPHIVSNEYMYIYIYFVMLLLRNQKRYRINIIKWAAWCENMSLDVYGQRRPRSAFWSGPSLPANRMFEDYTMYKLRAKAQTIPCACAGRSNSAHFAHARRLFRMARSKYSHHEFIWVSLKNAESDVYTGCHSSSSFGTSIGSAMDVFIFFRIRSKLTFVNISWKKKTVCIFQ